MAASLSNSTHEVYFVACHGGPADHFASFALADPEKKLNIHITAAGAAKDKFVARGVAVNHEFVLAPETTDKEKQTLAEKIVDEIVKRAKKTASATVLVVTDLGHDFARHIQSCLKANAPHIVRGCYFDNPESFVIGGYMQIAEEVMKLSQIIFFANQKLALQPIYSQPNLEIILPPNITRIGIGYYSAESARTIAQKRGCDKTLAPETVEKLALDRKNLRAKFFSDLNLEDSGQKIWFYFGGNNPDYFDNAFPKFLEIIKEAHASFENDLFVLQTHPGARKANKDGLLMIEKGAPVLMSPFIHSDDALILADGVLYYQTSMSFPLCGVPAIQVAHETFYDLYVKKGWIKSATSFETFLDAIKTLDDEVAVDESMILEALGYSSEWSQNFEMAVKSTKNETAN